jgi:hypothetical protein
LRPAGWRLERLLTDNGNEFTVASPPPSAGSAACTPASTPAALRPTVMSKTILDECWRPAFARYLYPRYTGLRREFDTFTTTTTTALTPAATPKAASQPTSSTVPERWSSDEPTLSVHPRDRPL